MALECLAPLGRLNFFGGLPKDRPMTTINANTIHYKHLKVLGTTRQSLDQYMKTINLIEEKKIDLSPLITGRFGFEKANRALQRSQETDGCKNIFQLSD